MAKNLSNNANEAASNQETNMRMLIDIHYETGVIFRLAAGGNNDLVVAGETYTAADLSRSDIQHNADSSLSSITITLSNRERLWAAMLAQIGNKFNNKRCVIKEVSEYYLDSESDIVTIFDGVINNLRMSSSTFVFDVERVIGSYMAEAPVMMYGTNCTWKQFKDSRCKYVGSETKCDRTFSRCQELGNENNFGGKPTLFKEVSRYD